MKNSSKSILAILVLLVMLCAQWPIAADAATTYTGTVTKDRVFFRPNPVASGGYLGRFSKGDKVTIYSVSGEFYKVKFKNKTGYVMKKFVDVSASAAKALAKTNVTTVKTDPKMKGITKISQIKVPSTTKKGNSGSSVLALQQALKIKGYYKPAINSKFDDATVAAVKAYQKAMKLTQNGQADNATIKKLFGKNAANYKPTATPKPKKTATPTPAKIKTQSLVWFSSGKSIFKSGVTFQVKDVQTGKVWKCKRLFAGNHLDAEPLTAADTKIMKAAYGGTINWKRRPVLVKINGKVYAGSMYGEPHGDQSITNNNFNGQFCIHFTGSKTSSSKVVDSAHQAAIKTALKASW